ncbi:MAG: carbon-nitrogen family hydrolase [Chloroflexi bacterium]|nr:carbon-nitrogen family hydrolase [Chloroflexota bacterium]
MRLKIACGQMDVQLGQPDVNLEKVREMTAVSAKQGADIVVFPELWSTGYDLENADRYATGTDSGMFAEMAALAQSHQIAILGSCLSLMPDGGYGNTAVFFNKSGQSFAQYSKMHLFRLMQEEQYLTAGDAGVVADSAWGKSGIAICYDLRFPELFRNYALAGAKIVFIPAEWPHPRLAHWQTLLQARAIENQMYVVACNRVGSSKGTDFFGHSCIIDPWGKVLVEGGEDEGVLTAVIDLNLVNEVRQKIPVFADRRPELYG